MHQEMLGRIAPEVQAFYETMAEAARLERSLAQLEAIRTRQLIERHAPRPPATVLDVGGGAGVYALWLAHAGYTVHLLDPVDGLVDAARARSAAQVRPIASCQVGEARVLPFPTASADVVLLLGPLYHLTAAAERARALNEAVRVLRPGGVLVAAVSRWASALYGLTRTLYAQPGFTELVDRVLRDGQNRNPDGLSGGFTTAYYHRPEELRDEVTQAGLRIEAVYGLEGAASLLSDFETRWADPPQREMILRLADALGAEPSLLGVSAHLLAVARTAP